MPLDLEGITAISHRIAAEHGSRIEIVGVAASDGGSERVELLVRVGSNEERVLLNPARGTRDEFERALREKLRDAVHEVL